MSSKCGKIINNIKRNILAIVGKYEGTKIGKNHLKRIVLNTSSRVNEGC